MQTSFTIPLWAEGISLPIVPADCVWSKLPLQSSWSSLLQSCVPGNLCTGGGGGGGRGSSTKKRGSIDFACFIVVTHHARTLAIFNALPGRSTTIDLSTGLYKFVLRKLHSLSKIHQSQPLPPTSATHTLPPPPFRSPPPPFPLLPSCLHTPHYLHSSSIGGRISTEARWPVSQGQHALLVMDASRGAAGTSFCRHRPDLYSVYVVIDRSAVFMEGQ